LRQKDNRKKKRTDSASTKKEGHGRRNKQQDGRFARKSAEKQKKKM